MMIKKSDDEMFRALVSWKGDIKLAFDSEEAKTYLSGISDAFNSVITQIRDIITSRRISKDEEKITEFRNRLKKLKILKK